MRLDQTLIRLAVFPRIAPQLQHQEHGAGTGQRGDKAGDGSYYWVHKNPSVAYSAYLKLQGLLKAFQNEE